MITLSNMNANEVIANRANQLLGAPLGGKTPVHPNDHVNGGQSSNDPFPTAMYIAVAQEVTQTLLPAVHRLRQTLDAKAQTYVAVVKTGRTHLQDATPITLGQEIGSWVAQLDFASTGLASQSTGLHAHPDFGATCARYLAALAAHDALVSVSAALRTLAGALLKLANDVRWLASGPLGARLSGCRHRLADLERAGAFSVLMRAGSG